jgi:protein-glutamine gamma-glutamyltransferase
VNRIATVFFISVYSLIAVAGLMLSFAEGSPFPGMFTPAVAVVAYVLTDHTKKWHLPVVFANALGIAVFALAGWQIYDTTTLEERLLAGSHLVVFLSWIVLFQEKRFAQYWWLCALSVLQISLGAILTNASSYGGMLIGFMTAAIWTLSLLSLYQAYLQYGEAENEQGNAGTKSAGFAWRGRRQVAHEARTLFLRQSDFRGTIQLDPDERWLGMRFALSMLGISSGALVIAAMFFLFIPRLWAGRTELGGSGTRKTASLAVTGFTLEVRLGDMVPLLESSKRVLQVAIVDSKGAPVDPAEYCTRLGDAEPLFRGATLETYANGVWTGSGRPYSLRPVNVLPEDSDFVRQQILMEPLGTPLLFAMHPVDAVRLPNAGDQAEEDPVTLQLWRPENLSPEKTLSYEIYSPARSPFNGPGMVREHDGYFFSHYTAIPPKLSRLKEYARQLAAAAPRAPADESYGERLQRLTEIMTRHMRDSGQFRYSLDTLTKDPKIDPIEDFLFNRKAGHCEYFASALALMLRSVGVPARVVSGFKGGAVNAISGVYEVEQRHAHVWVEAYLGQTELGEKVWKTCDATPAAREASVDSYAARIKTAHELASVVSSTWSRFVINMDIEEQNTEFYTPLLNAVRRWWSPETGQRPLLALIVAGIVDFVTDPTQWFTPTGIIVAIVIWLVILGGMLLFRMRSRLWRSLRQIWKPRRSQEAIRIAFYERFERLCGRLGLIRSGSQTQREFASVASPRIREAVVSPDGLPELPPRLVELFYRVRFGDETLPGSIVEELDRDLSRLEHAMRNPNRK